MSLNRIRYNDDTKKSAVALFYDGKPFEQISVECGASISTIKRWVSEFTAFQLSDGNVVTIKQIEALYRRVSQLEEENAVLKKAISSIYSVRGEIG